MKLTWTTHLPTPQEPSPMNSKLSVIAGSTTFSAQTSAGFSPDKLSIRSPDGKWQALIPREAFPQLAENEGVVVHFGITRVRIEQTMDEPDSPLVGIPKGLIKPEGVQ